MNSLSQLVAMGTTEASISSALISRAREDEASDCSHTSEILGQPGGIRGGRAAAKWEPRTAQNQRAKRRLPNSKKRLGGTAQAPPFIVSEGCECKGSSIVPAKDRIEWPYVALL